MVEPRLKHQQSVIIAEQEEYTISYNIDDFD